jgi:hypothetical protein
MQNDEQRAGTESLEVGALAPDSTAVPAAPESTNAAEPNRAARRRQEEVARKQAKAEKCPDTGGRHQWVSVASQMSPVPTGEVILMVIWACPCTATKINQAKVGESHAGNLVIPKMRFPGGGV